MADPPGQQPSRPKSNPWIIAISVMLATFIKVLDTAIVAVALPRPQSWG
jgi:DHA2 family multidrug resistance protein